MPLYHFVTNDLPGNTKASELDDQNAAAVLKADTAWTGEDVSSGSTVTRDLVGKYLKYMCLIGFLPPPTAEKGQCLPEIPVPGERNMVDGHVGGRGSNL